MALPEIPLESDRKSDKGDDKKGMSLDLVLITKDKSPKKAKRQSAIIWRAWML